MGAADMKQKFITLVLAVASFVSLGVAQDPKSPDAKAELQKLSPFVGEWTIHATWAGGAPLVAHNVNQWALNGAHLSSQTFVGEGAERYQRYQSMFSYDAKHGCLVTYSFAADGAVSAYRIDSEDGKTFQFGFTPLGSDENKVRQTITFKTADEYQWLVELNQNGTWTQIMDGTWKRDGAKETAK
jgi:hypothetical protein